MSSFNNNNNNEKISTSTSEWEQQDTATNTDMNEASRPSPAEVVDNDEIVMSQHEQEARRRLLWCQQHNQPTIKTDFLPRLPPLPSSLLLGGGNVNDDDDESSSPMQDVIDILDEVEMILDTPPVLGGSSGLSSFSSTSYSFNKLSSSSNSSSYMFPASFSNRKQ